MTSKINYENYKIKRNQALFFSIGLWLLALIIINDAFKMRDDFQTLSGKVIEKGNTVIKSPKSNQHFYYFKLDTNNEYYGIRTDENKIPILAKKFTGLNIGDLIQISFDTNVFNKNNPIKTVDEIKRNSELLYDNIPTSFWNGRFRTGIILFIIGLIPIVIILFIEIKVRKPKLS